MDTPAAVSDSVTFTEFARLAGFRRSYVTDLRKAGRLALNERGRILVTETRERIKATADPSKSGVAERHAANRQASASTAANGAAEQTAQDSPDKDPAMPTDTWSGMSYQSARAIREQYAAMAAKRDYEISTQQLLNAEDVRQAVLGTITTLRSRLESLPDILAPQVAVTNDEGKTRAILADGVSHALDEAARQFAKFSNTDEAQ